MAQKRQRPFHTKFSKRPQIPLYPEEDVILCGVFLLYIIITISVWWCLFMATDGTHCDQMEMLMRPNEADTEKVEASLTPRVVNLQHDDQSLISVVRLSWEGEFGQFLVTWQRLTSGLTTGLDIVGNLLTSHTSVPLSLQSNSLYLFTVRDVMRNTVSPDTLISTSPQAPPPLSAQKQLCPCTN